MKINCPTSKCFNVFFAFTAVVAALTGSQAYAVNGDKTGPLTGSFEIDGDLNISVNYDNAPAPHKYAGIKLDNGETVILKEGYEDSILTINLADAREPLPGYIEVDDRMYGLDLANGAKAEIGKLIINGKDSSATGIYTSGEGTEAKIGDYLEIYAGVDGGAISAYDNSTVVVGDNATLWGTMKGSAVVTAKNSLITIGNHARITNDVTYDLAHISWLDHEAVRAQDGGKVVIGDDAIIEVIAPSTTQTLGAVYAGDQGTSVGTIEIGKRAKISNQGENGPAVYSHAVGSSIKIGEGAELTTSGSRSAGAISQDGGAIELGADTQIKTSGEYGWGMLVQNGGTVKLGDNSSIETSGEGAHGLYAYTSGNLDGAITTGDGVEITATGKDAYGVYAYSMDKTDKKSATITLGENNVISSNSFGLFSYYTKAKIVAGDGLKITNATYAVYAARGGEIVLGDTEISSSGPGIYAATGGIVNTTAGTVKINAPTDSNVSVYVNSGGSVTMGNTIISAGNDLAIYTASATTDKSTFVGNGVFDVTGVIAAVTNSSIDLTFKNGSVFTGLTDHDSTGVVDLDMAGSLWNITDDSHVNYLSADSLSTLVFTIGGASEDDYVQIFSDMFAMSGGSSVKVILDGYAAKLGDEFLLVSSGGYDVSNITFEFSQAKLDEGLFWDTSRFATSGIIAITNIPEPATASLGLLGLAALMIRRRK